MAAPKEEIDVETKRERIKTNRFILSANVPDQLHRTAGTTDASGAKRNQHLACQRVGVSCIGSLAIFSLSGDWRVREGRIWRYPEIKDSANCIEEKNDQ